MCSRVLPRVRSSSIFILCFTIVGLAFGCSPASTTDGESGSGGSENGTESRTSSQEQFAWEQNAGAQLTVLANDHPWVSLIEERLEEFFELTGISVNLDVYPEDQFRTKREVEMRSGITNIDVYMIMPGNSLSKYVSEGWASPLDDLLADSSANWPGYNMDDFYDIVMESGQRDGRKYTMPILLETSLLAYNREIFDRFDLTVPETMEELEEAARTIYEGTDGSVAGITLRGRGAAATSQWADFLYTFGGSWFDESGDAAIHSDAAIEALEFYGRLLREYGPRGSSGNRWYESVSLFSSGLAGMIYDANVFRPAYEDPEDSNVSGSVGYAPIPEGPAGRVPHISHWALAVHEQSERKEAAWRFIQWATGPEISTAAQERGIPSARESVWQNSDSHSEWREASTRHYEIADSMWNPPVIDVDEAREAVGDAIVAAILKDNVEEAAQEASRRLDRLLEEEQP